MGRAIRGAGGILKELRRTRRWLADPKKAATYYPDAPKKSSLRVWADHLTWAVRHREVHRFYFLHGLDRRGARNASALPYLGSVRMVGRRNFLETTRDQYNYICILRDKVLFGIYASAMGHPTVRNVAELSAATVTWLPSREVAPIADLPSVGRLDGFAKPRDGRQGRGVFRLRIAGGVIEIDGARAPVVELQRRLDGAYLLQEQIVQHPRLSALHAPSVNTLRLITVRGDDGPQAFAAALRMGCYGNAVDNWAAGGIIVRVDLEAQRLRGPGYFKPGKGTRVTHHPDSGLELDGYELPFVGAAVAAARRFHADLPGIHSIGWDIALTEGGPVIIEGNEYWDTGIHMSTDPGFVQRFRDLFGPV